MKKWSAFFLLSIAVQSGIVSATNGGNEENTSPNPSIGCGFQTPVSPGSTLNQSIVVGGLERSYLLHVPTSYEPSNPVPLILSHHGWTSMALYDAIGSGLISQSERYGFVVAFLNGYGDNVHPEPILGTWNSWNGGGTVNSTSKKPGCTKWGGIKEYCYASCKARNTPKWKGCDSRGCDWTTCVDSTTFNIAVLDKLETDLCIDTTREYATGQSNGAIYSFYIGAVLSQRLAAVVPVSGSFMHDYIRGPVYPIPVMDITGTQDVTVPINDTKYGNGAVSSEGWIYSTMKAIFSLWEPANNCSSTEVASHYPTSLDGSEDLYCWGKLCPSSSSSVSYPVVRCAWNGGHNYFANDPAQNGKLVWEFLSKFNRPEHKGLGKFDPSAAPKRFEINSAKIIGKFSKKNLYKDSLYQISAPSTTKALGNKSLDYAHSEEESITSAIRRALQNSSNTDLCTSTQNSSMPRPFYGNPRCGCRQDEIAVNYTIADGVVGSTCAPAVTVCDVGGYRKRENGCPPPPFLSSLFTTCSSTNGPSDFHCVLTCDRARSKTKVDPLADGLCPGHAKCTPGFSRFESVGVCLYFW